MARYKRLGRVYWVRQGLVATWVCLVNLVLFLIDLPMGWPCYFANIFFFQLGATRRGLRTLLLGGTFGLLAAWFVIFARDMLAAFWPARLAYLVPLFFVLAVIILFGELAPDVLNNVAFAYMTISCIWLETIPEKTGEYLLVFWLLGGVMVGGSYAIVTLTPKLFREKKAK